MIFFVLNFICVKYRCTSASVVGSFLHFLEEGGLLLLDSVLALLHRHLAATVPEKGRQKQSARLEKQSLA